MTTPTDVSVTVAARLLSAVTTGRDYAGTLPAKKAVKVRPADWNAICDLAREAAKALSEATYRAEFAEDQMGKLITEIVSAEARLAEFKAEAMKVVEQQATRLDRITDIITRNLYHQREKVEDAKAIAQQGGDELRGYLNAQEKA